MKVTIERLADNGSEDMVYFVEDGDTFYICPPEQLRKKLGFSLRKNTSVKGTLTFKPERGKK
jgi:hypothetical protein